MIDEACALLATGPLCDPCLGRPFADRSFGLTNRERGSALRVTVAMADDEDFAGPDPEACWVCEGACARHDEWADRAAAAFEGIEFDTYQVGTRVPPLVEENDRLLREDAGMDPEAGELFKSAFNREVGKRFGERTGAAVDFERPDVVALLHLERGDVEVQVNPAFVYGRYRKLERGIPQTEWPCRECGGSGKQLAAGGAGEGGESEGEGGAESEGEGGENEGDGGRGGEEPCEHCGGSGYLYETSVEEEVAPPIREAMDGESATFHGAGREDVDALMLGTGRPFVVEVSEPRVRRPDLAALESTVNDRAEGRVEVEGLRHATHDAVERVKELPASKTYRAAVAFDAPVASDALRAALAELSGATVEQYTPERVDHRRASRTRTRTVYEADGELDDDRHATVEVHGEGGLYVKELIGGDGGRTDPSLAGLLGVGATVTDLDVLAVEGEDEQFEDPGFFLDGDPAA